MADIKDIHKAVCILEETGIVFTKEQLNILYLLEKQRIDNALPQIENVMRNICSSIMCKWSLKASYLYSHKWTVECSEKSTTSKSTNESIEKVYDQINMLRELGLPVGHEQMANVKAAEFVYIKDNVAPHLEAVLNNLIPKSITGIKISFCIKPKGKMTCDLVEPVTPQKSPSRKTEEIPDISTYYFSSSNDSNVDTKKLHSVFDKKVTSYKRGIRNQQPFFVTEQDEDGEETGEDVTRDYSWNYADILWDGIQAEKVRKAFEKLNYREQTLLEKRLAICMTCGRVGSWKNRPTFEELAVMFEGSSASGAERAYRKAAEHLTLLLVENGGIHAVRLKQKSKTKRKKKIATAVYEYQADCDGEWGEILFDFENGTGSIVRLADWDTMISNVFAKRVIRYLLNCENDRLPKETMFAFEMYE